MLIHISVAHKYLTARSIWQNDDERLCFHSGFGKNCPIEAAKIAGLIIF